MLDIKKYIDIFFWQLNQFKLDCFQRLCQAGLLRMAKLDGALDRVRKQLRSVLISEKHGVALERVERDYLELV